MMSFNLIIQSLVTIVDCIYPIESIWYIIEIISSGLVYGV
jgi:hypothetical protein